tara:strand:+ start:2665 stop:3945 length:1281 start_codon:yes stop_codon:yes gene_type:complete
MVKGSNRRMFRRPGSARKAAGILASSQELMNQVEPLRMNVGGSVDALAEYQRMLMEQATRQRPGNFLTDLGINMAKSALVNPQLGTTDAAIAGLTGAFDQAGSRRKEEEARQLRVAKGLADIEGIERQRRAAELREEQFELQKQASEKPPTRVQNAIFALGGRLTSDNKVIGEDGVAQSLEAWKSTLTENEQAVFNEAILRDGLGAGSATERFLDDIGVSPDSVRGLLATVTQSTTAKGEDRPTAIANTLSASDKVVARITAQEALDKYGIDAGISANQPVFIMEEINKNGDREVFAVDPNTAQVLTSAIIGAAPKTPPPSETTTTTESVEDLQSMLEDPSKIPEEFTKRDAFLRKSLSSLERLKGNRVEFLEKNKDITTIDSRIDDLEKTIAERLFDAREKRNRTNVIGSATSRRERRNKQQTIT